MSEAIRLAICDPNERSRENLKKYLVGMDRVWLEADCSRYEFFTEIVNQTSPDAVVIDVDADENKAIQLVSSLKAAHPGMGLIVVSARTDGQLILRAMRSGAGEFLNTPVQVEELLSALDRVTHTTAGAARSKSGSVIAVAGASGGVGCTTVAVNLACMLAATPQNSVVLVDLDLALGDADVFLDTIPDYTILDVATNISRLDLAMLRKSLTKHESGTYLLPRPYNIEDIDQISPEDFRKVMNLLKASFSHVVLDLSKSFSSLDRGAMQMADHVLLLTQLDLPCLRNVVRILTSVERLGDVSSRVKIVVNRVGIEKNQISFASAEETINREIFWKVPNNYGAVAESRNNGIPLIRHAPKAAVTVALSELAERLCAGPVAPAEVPAEERKERKGWLKFLSK